MLKHKDYEVVYVVLEGELDYFTLFYTGVN